MPLPSKVIAGSVLLVGGVLLILFTPDAPPSSDVATSVTSSQCAVQGSLCSSSADCGTCGAACEDAGTQNSGDVMIKRCTYLPPIASDPTNATCINIYGSPLKTGPQCQCNAPWRWNAQKGECSLPCDYGAPPAGCRYVGGSTDPFTCDARLVCDPPPSPLPYLPGQQVSCSACLQQGKAYACHDLSNPEKLNERGFCSDTKIAFSSATMLSTPDCRYCQAGPGVAWCPEDVLICPGGMTLSRTLPDCRFPSCPTSRSFSVRTVEPLVTNKKQGIGVCVVDQDGKVDGAFQGFFHITLDPGPLSDAPLYLLNPVTIHDQGCRLFPDALYPIRPGQLTMRLRAIPWRDAQGNPYSLDSAVNDFPPVSVSRTVVAGSVVPSPSACPTGQISCNGQCYVGNCCSNVQCSNGQTCAVTEAGNYCQGPTFPPSSASPAATSSPSPSASPSATPTPTQGACLPDGQDIDPLRDGENAWAICCSRTAHLVDNGTKTMFQRCGPHPSPTPTPTPSASSFPSAPPSASPSFIKGDLNGDGQVDIADLAQLVNYLTGRSSSL